MATPRDRIDAIRRLTGLGFAAVLAVVYWVVSILRGQEFTATLVLTGCTAAVAVLVLAYLMGRRR